VDKIRYDNIARDSVEECRYYLILTKDLEYSDISEAKLLLEKVSKLLEAYCQSVLNSAFSLFSLAKTACLGISYHLGKIILYSFSTDKSLSPCLPLTTGYNYGTIKPQKGAEYFASDHSNSRLEKHK
jgi:hypothetical protein